ncbi:Sodium-Dependent Proline Transporter [Manis pentadactyla]|nr:Sodium-Dependent Proline Transporter [Manis pentadactyla]
MKSSENNGYFDSSNARPFFVQAMAQHPYLSPWYQHPIYHPFSAPGAGVRYGSVYFPYAVMLSEYPGFLIPQCLLPTVNRGPVFYNTPRFQHYNGCGKEKKTRECQTECQKSKNMNEKQDNHSEGDGHDIGRVASVPSTNTDRETDNIPEETRGALSCDAQKRELHGKSPGDESLQGSAPQRSCASEGEKMRMEEGKGSPVVQFWKSLKETVRLYDLAYGKSMPENGEQHSGISQSSCEGGDVLDNPCEADKGIAHKDDQRAGQLEQCLVRCEMLRAGSLMDMNLNKAGQVLSSPGEVKDRGQIHKTVNSDTSQSAGGGSKYQQEKPFCSSNEGVKDLSLHSKCQTPHYVEGRMGTCSGDLGSLRKVVDEVVESKSYPEVCVSPAAWSAQFNKIGEGIQCDRSWWHEMEQKSLGSSPGSRKGTVDSGGSRDLDIYQVILSDSYPELCTYSPPRSPQTNRVHEGIQCCRCCCHGMEQRSPGSSARSSGKGTEESGASRDLDEYEVLESDSCTDGCALSPAWSAQVNRAHEGIQCGRCCWHGMEQRSPGLSAGSSGKGRVESGGSRDLDEYEVVEGDSYSEMCVPSPTMLAPPGCVDVGIMCNISLCQGEDVLANLKETALIGEGPLPYCRRKGSGRSVSSRELVGDEVVERKSYPESCGPSPTWSAQFNKVDEGIQCELSSQHDAELEKSSEQMLSADEESSAGCKMKGSRKKSVRNRKVNTDGEVVVTDETAEVYNESFKKSAKVKKVLKGRELQALSSFSNGRAVDVLKKNAALNTVLPKDSEDGELEEGGEDEMDEVECLLEASPDSPLTSSRGRFYGKAGRISRMPPESSVPQLPIWPTGNEYKAKHGDYGSIPVVCKATGPDGCEINCGRLRMECTVAKREGLESRRASCGPVQCNCERSKSKTPYKGMSKQRDWKQ